MSDLPDGPAGTSADASPSVQDDVARLAGQIKTMRGILVQLLQDVVRADSRLDQAQSGRLIEANEQLVLSALDARADAETANGALDEASRIIGLDALTGLPNRTVLLDRFEHAISSARRHGNRVALLFLDLNAFKQINDSFGHAAGDKALQLVAACLTSLVRETDTVSRHGGDEFLLLLAEITDPGDAALVAEKVNAALGEIDMIDGHAVSLTASIGIGLYPDDGADAKTLIGHADTAMYLAKQQQAGGFVFHADSALRPLALECPTAGRTLRSQPLLDAPNELPAADFEERHAHLREANEKLLLAALGAQELLDAAEEARLRQAELLARVADLLDPWRVASVQPAHPS